jgi:hypothetical protein
MMEAPYMLTIDVFMLVTMKTDVCGIWCSVVLCGGSKLLQVIGICRPLYMESHPRRQQFLCMLIIVPVHNSAHVDLKDTD